MVQQPVTLLRNLLPVSAERFLFQLEVAGVPLVLSASSGVNDTILLNISQWMRIEFEIVL
jgi:hypothetical protein